MTNQQQLRLAVDAKADLGEGPCWNVRDRNLYWVDIMGRKVHIHDPETNANCSIDVGMLVGAVVPRASGGLVLAAQHGFFFLDPDTGQMVPITDPEKDLPGNRFNDGKCDAAGRFWAGTMSMNGEKNAGGLYCLDTDLSVRKMIDNVTCSNGIDWSPDNSFMYYIDTPTKQVVVYDYDLDLGLISNPRTVVSFPDGGGVPDGMTVDAEGMIWVAQWGGYQVSRWNPRTGKLLSQIGVPAPQVTSCIYGGDHLDQLFITTARTGLDPDVLEAYPETGGVFQIRTGVYGLPSYSFGG